MRRIVLADLPSYEVDHSWQEFKTLVDAYVSKANTSEEVMIMLKVGSDYDDYPTGKLQVYYDRPNTPEEDEAEKAETMRWEAQKKEHDLAELRRLQAKYKNINV